MKINTADFIKKFEELFEETEQITASTQFKQLDEWSSLMALSVIAMIDEEFGLISKVVCDVTRCSAPSVTPCGRSRF